VKHKLLALKFYNEEKMDLVNNCRFCNIANGKFKYSEIDFPILENDKYMAFASIGALVPGWTLIVPRIHDVSMRTHYHDNSFKDFVRQTIACLKQSYPKLITFEHGANKKGSLTSCGTEHAHLHLVPYTESLLSDMFNSGLIWTKCKVAEIEEIANGEEYLFYSEINEDWSDTVGYLHILQKPISQFFRKIIASQIGHPEKFDYKVYPNLENSILTYKTLSKMAG